MGEVIVGQDRLVQRLLIALLAKGHVLLEGLPGLGKSLTVHTLAASLDASFQRIQFTPDLLPADLVGTLIYNPNTTEFEPRKGPLFANLVLADEINRAPAKVQSALLEAMQERHITLGQTTYDLAEPFLVLATQNPLEQEGTYPLPEAQLDRFLMKLLVEYPGSREERSLLDRMDSAHQPTLPGSVLSGEDLKAIQQVTLQIHVDPKIKDYLIDLVQATRPGLADKERPLDRQIRCGASPRAALALLHACKALALLSGRAFVIPDDVKDLAADVLRHRILLRYEAEAEGLTPDDVVARLLRETPVP